MAKIVNVARAAGANRRMGETHHRRRWVSPSPHFLQVVGSTESDVSCQETRNKEANPENAKGTSPDKSTSKFLIGRDFKSQETCAFPYKSSRMEHWNNDQDHP